MNSSELIVHKFHDIHRILSTESFLKMDALGGEIPFWISPYSIEDQAQVEMEIKNLAKKLLNEGIPTLTIDLFTVSCKLVEQHIGLERMFEVEQKKDKERFRKALQSTINIHERLIPEIVAEIQQHSPKILFIKGVGSVYPFIRSHNVLNNLQSAVKDIPTLMFFPGVYSGQSLNLFGMLKDDNYYRAFNIDNYKL
jgi:hypothetical protein